MKAKGRCAARWCGLPASFWKPGGRSYCAAHVPRSYLGFQGFVSLPGDR